MPNGDEPPWTVDTLRIYTSAQVAQLRGEVASLRREMATYGEANTAVRQAILAQLDNRFDALAVALNRADHVTDSRFELVNEFRMRVNEDARGFMPRTEVEAAHNRLAEQIGELGERFTRVEGRFQGAGVLWSYLVGGLGLLLAIIAAILAYTNSQRIDSIPSGMIAPVVQVVDTGSTGLRVGR